jgi:hypothetical protein
LLGLYEKMRKEMEIVTVQDEYNILAKAITFYVHGHRSKKHDYSKVGHNR